MSSCKKSDSLSRCNDRDATISSSRTGANLLISARKRPRRHSLVKATSLSPCSLAVSNLKYSKPNTGACDTSSRCDNGGDSSNSGDSISLSSGGYSEVDDRKTTTETEPLPAACSSLTAPPLFIHLLQPVAPSVAATESTSYAQIGSVTTTSAAHNLNFTRSVVVPPPSTSASATGMSVVDTLETPPVLPNEGRLPLLLLRPTATLQASGAGDSTTTGDRTRTTALPPPTPGSLQPWQLHDFDAINTNFENSLSGLSDLTPGVSYVNDMVEFVRKQQSNYNPNTPNAGNSGQQSNNETFFQYILMAPTSSAVRLHEEPLTYLNQSQSYEVKCKRLTAADSNVPPMLYKTFFRIGFHDRRQKFREKELLEQWKQLHHSSKIIDADVPMSINAFNVKADPSSSYVEFLWDSSKNTSVFIKINCMSTEFTARKHGGEKGVPFRLQVDTYSANQHPMMVEPKHLHSAYAQVKVFKTKGADRKIKTDRERAEKRGEKEKYQQSYDCTVLIETYPSADPTMECDLQSPILHQVKMEPPTTPGSNAMSASGVVIVTTTASAAACTVSRYSSPNQNTNGGGSIYDADSVISSQVGTHSPSPSNDDRYADVLIVEYTSSEVSDWLKRQRFSQHVKLFNGYAGTDLMRLTRDDFIQICGAADGIRLYNSVQFKRVQPKLTLYLCVPGAPAYHAVFLKSLTLSELVHKVCALIQLQDHQIYDVYCQGPDTINVHVNDEVVQNLPDRSRFTIDAMKCGEESECYRILLKSSGEPL